MLAFHVQVAEMQNLPDQDARRGLHLSVAASEHPFRGYVHLPGSAVSSLQSSTHCPDSDFPLDGCCSEPLFEECMRREVGRA